MINVLRSWSSRYLGDEQAVWLLVSTAVLALLVVFIGSTLIPVFASIVLAYLLQPLMSRLAKLPVPRGLAALLVVIFLVLLMVAVFFGLLPPLWSQSRTLLNEFPQLVGNLRQLLESLLSSVSIPVGEEQMKIWGDAVNKQILSFGNGLIEGSVAALFGLVQLTVYLVLVPLLVFFLLRDSKVFFRGLARLLPRSGHQGFLQTIWQEMDRQLANYVRGKVVEIIIMSVVNFIVFALMGLDYALLLAMLTGLSVLIPYVGAIVVTVPIFAVGYIQWGFSDTFLWLMSIYLILQILDGNVLVPLLFSEALNVHPVFIILSVLVFGGLWGFWGVFFAIPLATFVKAIFNAWPRSD